MVLKITKTFTTRSASVHKTNILIPPNSAFNSNPLRNI